ncbi:hypothetical protein HNQ00_002216 [Flavobacterium sp. 14A]|nr:hypothetical protein [Flavobacterium sp. 14A]
MLSVIIECKNTAFDTNKNGSPFRKKSKVEKTVVVLSFKFKLNK